ncbi:MAG: DUF420 domain-containing protein [Gemmatimonadales bacterium]
MSSVDAAEMRAAAERYEAARGVVAAPRTGVARAADFFELTKPRITTFVLLSAATGFFLGLQVGVPLVVFLHLMIGTALVAAGTNGFNHLLEGDVDSRMRRTRRRPIPTGRVSPREAGVFSALTGSAGIGYLALTVNPLTAALAAATLVALFGILFFWQLPHFLSLAWIYREDYRRAGLVMLPVKDPEGVRTRHQTLIHTLALLPISLLPSLLGLTGPVYLVGALGLGLAYLSAAGRFAWGGAEGAAWRVFRMSLLYLPLVYGLLVLDKGARELGLHDLPAVNAVLNGLTTLFLLTGWRLIRRGRMKAHRLAMLAAVGSSAAFLASYLVYHFQVGSVPYQGLGWTRTLYFTILITHSVLAASLVVLVPMTLIRALRGNFDRHRSLARGTLPVWLYVSVTGIIVYLMLYVL